MKRIVGALFVCLVAQMAEGRVRHYYKTSQSVISQPSWREETFGLTMEQRQALFRLTNGQVDFSGFHVSDTKLADEKALGNYLGATDSTVPPPVWTKTLSSPDPELDGQYWLEGINALAAWPLATGKGVVLADCDAGYYLDEADLLPNLLADLRYDLADEDDPLVVDDGPFVTHGTSVAAIIVGMLDGLGTNGVAYEARLVPLQNYNYDDRDDVDKEVATAQCVLKALEYPEVQIIVLENQTIAGSSETFAGTREAVELAIAAGVHVISAAGNYRTELTHEAEHDTGSVIVGALSQSGAMATFSNYGSRISVAAFGERLRTLRGPDGEMAEFGGTSGATPQVAAAVALMLEVNPGLSPAQVRNILETTRVEYPESAAVGGKLDVEAAVRHAAMIDPDHRAQAKGRQIRKSVIEILR